MSTRANKSTDRAAGQSPRRWRGFAAAAAFAAVGLAATAVAPAGLGGAPSTRSTRS